MTTNKFLKLRTIAMVTAVSQHICHLERHLGFYKNFIFSKTAANFFEISRKHVLTTSNRNIIKEIVQILKTKLEQVL